MARPLCVQLYSLREAAEKDFRSVLDWVAKVGYKGVEPAGFWDMKPAELKKYVEDLGMKIYSSHSPWARPDNLDLSMEQAHELGLNTIVCGYRAADFADLDAIKRTADKVNAMQQKLAANGFTLFQHNHDFEFERIDGKLKYQIYAELCPDVKFEIDSFWSTSLGKENAVEMLKLFADRTIHLHIKDGFCKQEVSGNKMVNGLLERRVDLLPLGTGDLPIKDLISAAPASVETVVVELDYCNIDMFEAIEQSYHYMVDNGLAAGNK